MWAGLNLQAGGSQREAGSYSKRKREWQWEVLSQGMMPSDSMSLRITGWCVGMDSRGNKCEIKDQAGLAAHTQMREFKYVVT